MGNQRCLNGELDTSNYSSPMPTIGLYITGSTLVCLLFIILDIHAGFHNRKRWLPCHFFSLNSVTLTLFSVATKLPVDLTTAMPSVQDQLSKLTGTTFICICMCFLTPSLGLTTYSECLSNMIALTIFVITVYVNVCIQMRTGVIVLFKGEHIIVLCCMLLLLGDLWIKAMHINSEKIRSVDDIKACFRTTHRSLLQKLKVCYLYGYICSPQLLLCRELRSLRSFGLCIVCAGVLALAIFRSFVSELEVCKGNSDYRWSMWAIVASQTITVLVGCLGATIRFLSMVKHLYRNNNLTITILTICFFPVSILPELIFIWLREARHVRESLRCFWEVRESNDRASSNSSICCIPKVEFEVELIEECKELMSKTKIVWDDWVLKKGITDMKRRICVNRFEVPIDQLIQLLRRTRPSLMLTTLLREMPNTRSEEKYQICPLSIVALAKIITMSIPLSISRCIQDSTKEVFIVLQYIDKKTGSKYFKDRSLKQLWDEIDSYHSAAMLHHSEQRQLNRAIELIKEVKVDIEKGRGHCLVKKEFSAILGLIENRTYASIEDLHKYMEQLFVDMLSEFINSQIS